jgi:probable phosphoglycerate mutase
MQSLLFVRHGQTDFSLHARLCGSIDPPLNATGLAMAEALGQRYGSAKLSAIYASPSLRARQTAEPTARAAGLPLRILDGLREISYGDWEGLFEADLARDQPDRFRAWQEHPARVAPPGGETAVQIAERGMAALAIVRGEFPEGRVMVVSHKATLRIILCSLLGVDVDLFRSRIAQKVCAVSVVDWKASGPLLTVLGDVSHLPPDLRTDEGT